MRTEMLDETLPDSDGCIAANIGFRSPLRVRLRLWWMSHRGRAKPYCVFSGSTDPKRNYVAQGYHVGESDYITSVSPLPPMVQGADGWSTGAFTWR